MCSASYFSTNKFFHLLALFECCETIYDIVLCYWLKDKHCTVVPCYSFLKSITDMRGFGCQAMVVRVSVQTQGESWIQKGLLCSIIGVGQAFKQTDTVATNAFSIGEPTGSQHYKYTAILLCINTYSDFIHGLLNIFPQGPGTVTHQVCDVKALAQGHKLSILVSVSRGWRP